jgi:ADP-ribosyl-[dinitrogen reductase] hydrolase
MRSEYEDRARGALFGLAIGDALGAPLEFKPRDSQPIIKDYSGGGPFNLRPGEWTDDTAMALCLADSLIAHGDLDEVDLMTRFVRWWRHGENSVNGSCFDIGRTTAQALARFERTRKVYVDEYSELAGNGAIMRLAPAAVFGAGDFSRGLKLATRQGEITHGSTLAVHASIHFADLLLSALEGKPKSYLFDHRLIFTEDRRLGEIGVGLYRRKSRDEIRSTGFVLDTLEAALWSVYTTESFGEALITAVNLGGDADTVGAVTGQLAGALYGVGAIPARWLDQLASLDSLSKRWNELILLSKPENG